MTHRAPPELRRRGPDDADALEAIGREVQRHDGYPVYLRDDDMTRFLSHPAPLDAWVAVDGTMVVGHVALNRESSPGVMELVAAAGIDARSTGFVARLLVAPNARRRGIGRRLIDRASEEAVAAGLTPLLDVVATSTAAIELYERAGWTRLGIATLDLPDGRSVEEVVYRGPRIPT